MKRTNKTKTRELFLQTLARTPSPLSLEEMHQQLARALPGLAFSTIYRLAKNLELAGQITRVDWRERGSRYELASGVHHHHIVCTRCDRSADIEDTALSIDTAAIGRATGFRLGAHYFELEGLCADCQKQLS